MPDEELKSDEADDSEEEDEYKDLILQVEDEWNLCYKFMSSKRTEWLRRLKLYNNAARDKSKVGDPLLFTVFQTVFSSLYEDRLSAEFEGNEEGDKDTAENVTALAEHDYRVMHKAESDHDWDWDACFFGRGLLLVNEFDRAEGVMAPVSEVIDPVMWLRDPAATSVNGDMQGRGSMRFGGREINITKAQMKAIPGYINLEKLKKGKDTKSVTNEVRQERQAAQGTDNTQYDDETLNENYEYNLRQWFTHVDGKKLIVELGNEGKLVVRIREDIGDLWPIIDRTLFPIAHDWDGVSIPDLIEDKQRARAKMMNLALDSAIAELHPMYLYNKKKIRNKRDLDFAFNKMVGVSGDVNNTIEPMQKSTFHQMAREIMDLVDLGAQKAVASPETAQGIQPKQDRTLGETELVAAGRNARMSLAASIWGWSEKRFWNQWYALYKKHFKEDLDEKVIRIRGPLATAWRTLTRENLIAEIDPDVYVESLRVAEQKRAREFQEFSALAQIAMQDPSTNRRYVLRRLGRISRLKSDELFLMFPPTPDEILATDENQLLSDNKFVPVNVNDDDIMHMEKHREAAHTPATLAHIQAHKIMMIQKRDNPALFPIANAQQEMNGFSPVNGPEQQQPLSTEPIGQEAVA